MAIINVDLDEQYTPKTENVPIILSVDFGDGQPGVYVVFLDDELKATDTPAKLGIKSEVSGKITTVVANIDDVLEETNFTSLTIFISEVGTPAKFGPFKKLVAQHDQVIYTIQILHP